MSKQSGFTLIELVVVIIVLGILSAAVAPKFINLSSDARISTLQGMKGAVSTATLLSYSKTVLLGLEKSSETDVKIGTETIRSVYGYPKAEFSTTWSKLLEAEFGESGYDDRDAHEWMWRNVSNDGLYFMPRGYSQTAQNCWVKYAQATASGGQYQLSIETGGC